MLALFTVAACRKDRNKVISKVVTTPHIQLNGSKFISLKVGDALPADDGATVVDDEPVDGNGTVTATENTIDVNTPGIYYMLYKTKTRNGYSIGAARYIAVTDYADDVDLSGTYVRTSNGIPVEVTRVSRGMYRNSDMGGAGLADVLYFTVVNDTTIVAGPQYSETIQDIIDVSKTALHIEDGNTFFKYALDAPGYGTAVRTFVKQE